MKSKIIIGTLIAGVGLLAATMGVALAQTATSTPAATDTAAAITTPTATPVPGLSDSDKALADALAAKLGLDSSVVETDVVQVRAGLAHSQIDAKVKARLDAAVKAGRISQSDADAIYAWLQSRPVAADSFITNLLHGGVGGNASDSHDHHGESGQHGKASGGHDNDE